MKRRGLRTLGFLLVASLIATGFAAAKVQSGAGGSTRTLAASGCQLASAGGNIKHVIYIQFDNTHFLRDNANVASDLEQMPNLLNFIRGNGSLLTNDHTALISHTATGILTSLTGVYPDRQLGMLADALTADLTGAHQRFFDRWLRGQADALAGSAPVRIFVMGIDQWRDEQDWPLPDTSYVDYYLHEAQVGTDPDQRDYIVSNAKIEATGFLPQFSLDAGIAELIKGYTMMRRTPLGNV